MGISVKAKTAIASAASFRSKGLVYVGARSYYDSVVPGGWSAVRDAVGDDGLRTFMGQPFLPGGWYDVLPVVPISATAARLRGVSQASLVRDNARWVAERDLAGVYRILVSVVSPETVAMRLPRLSMQYFDFGGFDAKMVRENVLESHRFGIPAALAPWFVFVTEGFVPYALSVAGAKDVRIRYGPPRPEGEANGTSVVRLRFEIDWT